MNEETKESFKNIFNYIQKHLNKEEKDRCSFPLPIMPQQLNIISTILNYIEKYKEVKNLEKNLKVKSEYKNNIKRKI